MFKSLKEIPRAIREFIAVIQALFATYIRNSNKITNLLKSEDGASELYLIKTGRLPFELVLKGLRVDLETFLELLEKNFYILPITERHSYENNHTQHGFRSDDIDDYRFNHPAGIYELRHKDMKHKKVYVQIEGNPSNMDNFVSTLEESKRIQKEIEELNEQILQSQENTAKKILLQEERDALYKELDLPIISEFNIAYAEEDESMINIIMSNLTSCKLERYYPPHKPQSNFLVVTYNEMSKSYGTRHGFFDEKDLIQDMDLHYNPLPIQMASGETKLIPMSRIVKAIVKSFKDKKKGAAVFSGLPGVGKTVLLSHIGFLVSKDVTVLKVTATILKLFSQPSFQNFLHSFCTRYPGLILWVEDGDGIIEGSDVLGEGRSEETSELLNLLDGPAFKEYGIRMMMTHNINTSGVDQALFRPGRSIFGGPMIIKPLEKELALQLAAKSEAINEDQVVTYFNDNKGTTDITLADLYNTYGVNGNLALLEEILAALDKEETEETVALLEPPVVEEVVETPVVEEPIVVEEEVIEEETVKEEGTESSDVTVTQVGDTNIVVTAKVETLIIE